MARESTASGENEQQTGMSAKGMIISVVLSIVIGGGSGFGMGYFFGTPDAAGKNSKAEEITGQIAAEEKKQSAEGEPHITENEKAVPDAKDGEGSTPAISQPVITVLDPIVTNLNDPSEIWIRLELALSSDQPLEPEVSSHIHQDLFAHVHAMRLDDMAGPSAFVDFKAELLARARQRSGNIVQDIYVKTLLYE